MGVYYGGKLSRHVSDGRQRKSRVSRMSILARCLKARRALAPQYKQAANSQSTALRIMDACPSHLPTRLADGLEQRSVLRGFLHDAPRSHLSRVTLVPPRRLPECYFDTAGDFGDQIVNFWILRLH